MRPLPQPVLIPPPYCGPCPLASTCPEADTDAACDEAGAHRLGVHPGTPIIFEQFHSFARSPARPLRSIALPALPRYTTILPREAGINMVQSLGVAARGFSVHDFRALIRRAEREGRRPREFLGGDAALLLVLGADPDRAAIRDWQDWPEVRDEIVAQRPDLVVGPDLGFYENDQPASRQLFFNAHTRMYADLVDRGIPALPPMGWTLPSDFERLLLWVREYAVPGAFLDLQQRMRDSSFEAVVADLRRYRDGFPRDFLFLVNGVQHARRMEVLQHVLGTVRFTSSGPWHLARNHRVLIFDGGIQNVSTDLPVADAVAESARALTAAAEAAYRRTLERVRVMRPRAPDSRARATKSRKTAR